MQSKQIGLLDELRGLIPDRAVDILKQALGNIGAALEHHGPIKVKGSKGRPSAEVRRAGDLHVDEKALAWIKGKVFGVCRWAKVIGDWEERTNNKSGLTEYWVSVRGVDHDGLHPTGPPWDLRLCVTGGNMPDLLPDDMLAYFYDTEGQPVSFPSVSQYPGGSDGNPVAMIDTQEELVLLA